MIPNLSQRYGEFHRLPKNNLKETGEYISVCGWCGKVLVGNDWLDVGEAIGKLQLFDLSSLPRPTHGLCSCCKVEVEREIDEFKERHHTGEGR